MHRHAALVEGQQHRLCLHAVDRHAHEMGEAVLGVADRMHAGHRAGRGAEALGMATRGPLFSFEPVTVEQLGRRRAEADDRRHVLDPPAPGAFLRATQDERRDAQPTAYQERGRAFRPAELVGRHRAQVGIQRTEVDGDVTGSRARVDVDQRARGTCRADDLGDGRLHRSHLVVRELDADECGAGPDRGGDGGRVDARVAVHADLGDVDTHGDARRATAGVEHGRVFDRGRDDVDRAGAVGAALDGPGGRAPDRGVDRFRPARRKDDLAWACTEQRRDLFACDLDRDARHLALGVDAPRVTRMVAEEREHRRERGGAQRRRRCVVEVRAGHQRATVTGTYTRAPGTWATRATQWSSPSGRLASNCGDVSP